MFVFADHLVVENLSKVPADFHGLYVEKDGKYHLRSEDPGVQSAVKAITSQSTALKAARSEAEEAKKGRVDLSPLAEYGSTVEEIAAGVKAKITEAAGAAKGSTKEAVDTALANQKTEMQRAHKAELDARDAKDEKRRQQLHKVLVSNELNQALAACGCEAPELALPHLSNTIRVVEDGDEMVVQVVDENQQTRFNGATGKAMSIADRVAEFKADERYARLFKTEAGSGGGRRPGGTPPGGGRPQPGGGEEKKGVDKIQSAIDKGVGYGRGRAAAERDPY